MIIRKMVKSTNVLAFIVNRILMFVLVGYLYYLLKTDGNISSFTVIRYGWTAMFYYCIFDTVIKVSKLKYRLANPLLREIKVEKDYSICECCIPVMINGNSEEKQENKPIGKIQKMDKRIRAISKATWLNVESVLTIISYIFEMIVMSTMCFLFYYGIQTVDFSKVTVEGILSVWFVCSILSFMIYKLSYLSENGCNHYIRLRYGESEYILTDRMELNTGRNRAWLRSKRDKSDMFMDVCIHFFELSFDICKLLSCAFIIMFASCGLCELWMVYPYMPDVFFYFSLLIIVVQIAKILLSEVSYEIDRDIVLARPLSCGEEYKFFENDIDKKKLIMWKSERNDKNEYGTI